jgi:hypothetical protein
MACGFFLSGAFFIMQIPCVKLAGTNMAPMAAARHIRLLNVGILCFERRLRQGSRRSSIGALLEDPCK